MERQFPVRDIIKAMEKSKIDVTVTEFIKCHMPYLEKKWAYRSKLEKPSRDMSILHILKTNDRVYNLMDENKTIGKTQLILIVMSLKGCSEYHARNAVNMAIKMGYIKEKMSGGRNKRIYYEH